MRLVIFVGLISSLLLARPALAFEPELGNRAAPLVGRDLISGATIDLESYLGKWVFLCFWASW